MTCACGKTALYRFGAFGFCANHREQAVLACSTKRSPSPKTKFALDTCPKHMNKVQQQRRRQELLKANRTPAEVALATLLYADSLTRGKYLFQPLLKGFYPDFLNEEVRLIIEVDGWRHYTPSGKQRDAQRTAVFARSGYRVIRFANKDVLTNPRWVMQQIIAEQEGWDE
jgi:very-short-patch-repair endonuclease